MIGILAPYTGCEATAAAIRLADLCLSYGEQPRIIAIGPCRPPVHEYWDRYVWSTSAKAGSFVDWSPTQQARLQLGAADCRLFVHISSGSNSMVFATLANFEAQHIFVPCWHHLNAADLVELFRYRQIVCPSRDLYKFLGKHAACPINADSLTWTRFDAGLPYAAAERSGPLTVGCIVNGATIDSGGFGLLRCLETLLVTHPTLNLRLLHSRSWPDNDRRCIQRLVQTFGPRCDVRRLTTLSALTRQFHELDWTLLPWPRADFGSVAARSIACGVPVVSYDVSPLNEIICNEHNGHLVRCELQLSPIVEAPSAIPDVPALTALCLELFADRKAWTACRKRTWRVDEHVSEFSTAWAKILGLI